MMTFRQEARIAWRRGQWATVAEFLRGDHRKRTVGPGMEEPPRRNSLPDLARLDRTLR